MTRELENQLKQMFAAVDEDLLDADFTPEVMSEVHGPRRHERLLWCSAVLAAVVFLWCAFRDLEAGLRVLAGFSRTLFALAGESVVTLLQTPLFYIYGTALGGYILLRLMRRLQILLT